MTIKLFASLRHPVVGGRLEVQVPNGSTVRHALELLFEHAPSLREQVLHPETRELLPFVQVMLKGRLVRDLHGLDTPVADTDELALFPPIAGG
jgi:molybdopterin synthase sulfur carrier subunit